MENKTWKSYYGRAANTLARVKEIQTVVTAFNANIDSVVKISGQQLKELIDEFGLSLKELSQTEPKSITSPQDLIRGIFRCFCLGIAEEWIAENEDMYRWMQERLGLEHLQIGAQAGIIANTLSITGIKKIIVHNAALPKIQAEQYLPNDNLLSFDAKGYFKPVYKIDRPKDKASIHWIIEFNGNDSLTVEGKTFTCPKANRFIATYDPLLFNMTLDKKFVRFTTHYPADYIILSGYQALTVAKRGVRYLKKTLPILAAWRERSPKAVIHLELASTQDAVIRKTIVHKLKPYIDSVGLNDRETLDLLEVFKQTKLIEKCTANPTSVNYLKALLFLKEKFRCKRIQLHMFGLYMTIQDDTFPSSPLKSRRGMILASTAAASKAYLGYLRKEEDILAAQGLPVSEKGMAMLKELATFLKQPSFYEQGIGTYKQYDIIAVPTIIVPEPRTLVGMGDTISAFSLVGSY